MLLAAEIFDHETKSEYYIRVRCKDEGNLVREEVFIIHIKDRETIGMDYKQYGRIIAYPNPFNESTTLLFNNPEGSNYTLYITDLSGKICRIATGICSSNHVVERSTLEDGIYFIELRGPETFRGKFIIR
jgi:hypothetical protein